MELPKLWTDDELPRSTAGITGKNFKSLRYPLWTQNKARLIQAYLQLFEFITHHGTYIDGFAAPQDEVHPDMWAAKLVLKMMPKWFHDFWLCDLDASGIQSLKSLLMPDNPHHQRHRAAARGVQATHQDPMHAALRRHRLHAVLGIIGQRTDHPTQN